MEEKNTIEDKSVIVIGTGAVATNFIKHFLSIGITVIQQYGRTIPLEITIPFISDINNINTDADLYIIAVSDDAIAEVVEQLPSLNGLVVHTAGSVSLDIFASKFSKFGVFYPVQSFSNNRNIDLQLVPFIIEGNSMESVAILKALAVKISNNYFVFTYEKRLQLHLAAVFASNFSNHMNSIAQELLLNENIDFTILRPLLQETFNKILTINPLDAQTGPAKRNDINVLEKHSEILTNNPIFQEIYTLISKSISTFNKK